MFQGRIHQIEYAMEAVKQGSATVGLKSKTQAVLVALKVWPPYFITLCDCFGVFLVLGCYGYILITTDFILHHSLGHI